ncbi:MAG: hypothetical protein PHR81_07765 [Bacteroidales bacterium]|jgi:ketosteroid isomerase-like protein|nr:hypothetical protein [Bacteroidales bacterium]MDD4214691.1 hypothetical protein [Bacteroidales bacterium]
MKQIIVLFFLLTACMSFSQNVSKKNQAEITALLITQEKYWNNGDIKGYMNGYWNSDSLKFITKTDVYKGWNAALQMYSKHYPDKEAMGTLSFEEIDMLQMNAHTIFVMGKWTLKKTKETVGGHFTLICKKLAGKWKIIIDHSS